MPQRTSDFMVTLETSVGDTLQMMNRANMSMLPIVTENEHGQKIMPVGKPMCIAVQDISSALQYISLGGKHIPDVVCAIDSDDCKTCG
jgi:hypothetical protein